MKQTNFLQKLLIFVACMTLSVGMTAQTTPQKKRLKVGLVLGGGGAKGAAEIGVLKVLEEVGIPIDYIAGTSIGSIVGGLKAIGVRADSIESLFRSQKWGALFAKEFIGGCSVENLFDSICQISDSIHFDDLPIPFRCVAVDSRNMEEVVLDSGSLATAMRASMAIPGVFRPVKWDGKKLVDGGVLNNLPVDVVLKMGADVVIAVDLQQKKSKPNHQWIPKPIKGVNSLLQWVLLKPDRTKYENNKNVVDVLINPRLKKHDVMCFLPACIDEMIAIGEKTARQKMSELIKLKRRIYAQ